MISIRASIASRATELRPTASSEKSRERARFPLCVFLACLIVSHCACCQDFPPPPSPPRLDSPSLRPSLAAVQLRELLQAGSFAVRSDVRPQLSVRALPSESPVHSPLQRGRASASWLDEALRSPSPLRPVSETPPSQPGSFSVSAFEVVSSAAPPHAGSIRPGPLAAAPSIASPPTPVVSPNPVACPRRWADGRPNSAYRPRGFDEVRPCSAPSSPSLRIPVSSSTFSFSPSPVSSALPAPPLPRGTLPAHLLPPVARARPSLRLLACTRALGCYRSPRRLCTSRRWPPLLLKPVWLCPLLAAFIRPCWLCPRAGWLFCVRLPRPPHCSLTARLPPTPKLT